MSDSRPPEFWGDGDETLDTGRGPGGRRWWAAVLVTAAAVVIALAIVRVSTGSHPAAGPSHPVSSATRAADPIIPYFPPDTSSAVPVAPPAPAVAVDLCPKALHCRQTSTSARVRASIRAEVVARLGTVTRLRITSFSVPAADPPHRSALLSRTVVATVPAGRLELLATAAPGGSHALVSPAPRGSALGVDGRADGYVIKIIFSLRGATSTSAVIGPLNRLSGDARLVGA